ncbi:protein NYNRIN-like [Ranitomeya variabilis]|uniref:protein NYNRIN-like n=1 Tax=Ranitomeya variabilis TaxID=490064 RepID=UPI0040578357
MELQLQDPASQQGAEDRCVLKAFPLMMMTLQTTPSPDLPNVPTGLWSTGPEDVGLLKVPPVKVHLKPGHPYPRLPQYPLKAAQEQSLGVQITSLLRSGVLIRCVSPCNTPLFPVKKKTAPGEPPRYRLVQDLRAVNSATILETPVVPNPNTLLSQVPTSATLFTVIDLANAFFSVPLHEDSQFLFAFTFQGSQLTWTRTPQGAQNSPNQFTHAMKMTLDPWVLQNLHVTLLQYVDDLLLCGTEENLFAASESLLLFLHSANCKVSKAKVQWCKEKVVFLGHCISQGSRHLTEDRKHAIEDIPYPKTYSAMQSFLGLITYCRQWIPDASRLMQPLYDCLKTGGPDWEHAENPYIYAQQKDCFETLKEAVVSAPALGLPDYTQPFHLFVSESEGYASGVLAQKHVDRFRPLAYYSARLDPVARTAPSCLKAVHAAHVLLDKSADIALGHDLVIQAGHDLSAVLQQTSPKHLTSQRHLRLQCSLLLPSNITFQKCTTINPATLLPHSRGELPEWYKDLPDWRSPGDPHDCVKALEQEISAPQNVVTQELLNPDLQLWTDGSRFADSYGKFHTGYAVTTDTEVLLAEALPPHLSAQEAELVALQQACYLAEGKTANVYTDSRYGYGICHDFGFLWKSRGFITATGTPVKHALRIKALMKALELPAQIAVIKVKAHGKVNSKETRGNHLADQAAKAAAIKNVSAKWEEEETAPEKPCWEDTATPVMPVLTRAQTKEQATKEATQAEEERDFEKSEARRKKKKKLIEDMEMEYPATGSGWKPARPPEERLWEEQKLTSREEKKQWEAAGAIHGNRSSAGQYEFPRLYKVDGRPCLPKRMYPAVAAWAHGSTHRGKNQALACIKKLYWAPGISTTVTAYSRACPVCAICNPTATAKVPLQHLAKPDYPWQRIQVDHIQMPKSGKYEYVLVAVDMFSGWPEAYPVTNMTAKTTAKKLITEISCRFGIPEVVESDQGPAFTANVYEELWHMLGTDLGLHTPYHPSSSAKVERMNSTIKTQLLKMSQDHPLPWPDLLPVVLYHIRHTPQGKHGLTPFEILFGAPPKIGDIRPQELSETNDKVVQFVIALSKELSNTHSTVSASLPESTGDVVHDFVPGDLVYVKKFVRRDCLQPRFEGPHTVILVTPTAVKLEGKSTWIHASHCKRDRTSV